MDADAEAIKAAIEQLPERGMAALFPLMDRRWWWLGSQKVAEVAEQAIDAHNVGRINLGDFFLAIDPRDEDERKDANSAGVLFWAMLPNFTESPARLQRILNQLSQRGVIGSETHWGDNLKTWLSKDCVRPQTFISIAKADLNAPVFGVFEALVTGGLADAVRYCAEAIQLASDPRSNVRRSALVALSNITMPTEDVMHLIIPRLIQASSDETSPEDHYFALSSVLRLLAELDALLPNLLSELGYQVISRPATGVRQFGVDVAAVGLDDSGQKCLYLFSVKPGDLTRSEWNAPNQGLRDSINDILDGYVPSHILPQHRHLPIKICLCLGGNIDQSVDLQVTGFLDTVEKRHCEQNIRIQIWDGDLLTDLILQAFLREDLMPKPLRGHLRKTLALLDEPEASIKHFAALVRDLFEGAKKSEKARLTALRQMNLCLWIVYAWALDAGNLDVPQRASILVTLRTWDLVKDQFGKKSRASKTLANLFHSATSLQLTIGAAYFEKLKPAALVLNGLGSLIGVTSSVDVNLKLFDIIGRLGIHGLLLHWYYRAHTDKTAEGALALQAHLENARDLMCEALSNNSALCTPLTDNQAIDINIACLFLAAMRERDPLANWIRQMVSAVIFTFKIDSRYPSRVSDYRDLLKHPKLKTKTYRDKVTEASILFPTLGAWAAILADEASLEKLSAFVSAEMDHCNMQVWLPDIDSEDKLFSGDDNYHGLALDTLTITADGVQPLQKIKEEVDEAGQLDALSASKYQLLPLVVMACRHQGLPLPPQYWLMFWRGSGAAKAVPPYNNNV